MKRENPQISERIDQYLQGALSAADRVAFEIQMEAEPELAKEVELRQGLQQMLSRREQVQSFRELQGEIADELATPMPQIQPATGGGGTRWLRWVPAAAAGLLLITCGYLFYQVNSLQGKVAQLEDELDVNIFRAEVLQGEMYIDEASTERQSQRNRSRLKRLGDKYADMEGRVRDLEAQLQGIHGATREIALDSTRRKSRLLAELSDRYFLPRLTGVIEYEPAGDQGEQELMARASEQFNLRNYNSALRNFEMMKKEQRNSNDMLFALGVCYMSGDVEKSIELLERAYQNNEIPRDQWHLALAYLRFGDVEKTKQNLEEIIAHTGDDDEYHQYAEQLLEDLDDI